MSVNVELLRDTAQWAYVEWQKDQAGEISHWWQRDWMIALTELAEYGRILQQPDVIELAVHEGESCGTACCIAGRIALTAGWAPDPNCYGFAVKDGQFRNISELARELLGLEGDQAQALFEADNNITDVFVLAHRFTDGAITIPEGLPAAHTTSTRYEDGEVNPF
jgi:hypothetical protein